MDLYAMAMVAIRKNAFDFDSGVAAGSCIAQSREAATEIALQTAREQFPPSAGWSGHLVAVSVHSDFARRFAEQNPAQ